MKPKLRVLQLLHEPGDSVATVANEYTRSLDRTRFHVTVAYLFSAENTAARTATAADVVIFCNFPKRERGGLRWQALRGLRELCTSGDYTAIICHRHKAAYLLAWIARRWVAYPRLFYVIHGTQSLHRLPGFIRSLLMCRLIQPYFEFIAVSAALRASFLRTYPVPPARITTVANALEVVALDRCWIARSEARQQLGLGADDFVLGNIGRLVPFKQQLLLLRVFAQLGDELPTARLVIIGDGPCRHELVQLLQASPALQGRVILAGVIPEAARLMPAFDGFVLSSLEEPFGLVLLEAMGARLPIIAHASGGVPEVLGDTGMLLQEHSVAAFAEAIRRLYALDATARALMGARGRVRLEQVFAFSRFGEFLLQRLEQT